MDRHLDIRLPPALRDVQFELPCQVHHALHRRLFRVLGRFDLHLRCHPRNLEDPQTLSRQLPARRSLGLLVLVSIHRSQRESDEYQRYEDRRLSLSRHQLE